MKLEISEYRRRKRRNWVSRQARTQARIVDSGHFTLDWKCTKRRFWQPGRSATHTEKFDRPGGSTGHAGASSRADFFCEIERLAGDGHALAQRSSGTQRKNKIDRFLPELNRRRGYGYSTRWILGKSLECAGCKLS